MDYHILPGTTAKEVAQAHAFDVEQQDKFNCRAITYWMDEKRGTVFCLFDAPDKECVAQLHNNTHGSVPHEIIEVNSQVVEAFLGRLQDPEGYYEPSNPKLKIFNEPAFRTIVVIKSKDDGLFLSEPGRKQAKKLFSGYHKKIREKAVGYEGREVDFNGECAVISFASGRHAVECAFAIQKSLAGSSRLLDLRIGIHGGIPVYQSSRVFGKAISFASYLCNISNSNQVVISSTVKNLYDGETSKLAVGKNNLKCISPAQEEFLEQLLNILENNRDESAFGVTDFCREMAVSKTQLYRKCKSLTGMSVNAVLREFRLDKSLNLLKNGNQNINQVAYEVGFNSPSYFTKCFRKRFGIHPLTYLKQTQ